MSNNIEGKVVVITGASSGLGEATARHLSAQGAILVLGARRTDRIESLAAALSASGGKALAITTDVTHCDQVKRLVDAAAQTYGRIDVMINNAGLMPQAPIERLKIDEWERMIDVNIKGVLYGIAAALPHMKRQKAGHFINVSSVAGRRCDSRQLPFARPVEGWPSPSSHRGGGDRVDTRPIPPDRQFNGKPTRSRALSPSPSASRRRWTSMRSCSGPPGRNFEREAEHRPREWFSCTTRWPSESPRRPGWTMCWRPRRRRMQTRRPIPTRRPSPFGCHWIHLAIRSRSYSGRSLRCRMSRSFPRCRSRRSSGFGCLFAVGRLSEFPS